MGFNLDAFLTVPEHNALNHAGLPGVGGGGGGGTIFSVSEVAHGFVVGQPIYFDGVTSGWNLAKADNNTTTSDCLVFSVTDVDNFDYVLAGELELTVGEWDAIVGATSSGLVAGEHYRLDEFTAGMLTLEAAGPGISQFVMRALSDTKALVYMGEPHASAFVETRPNPTSWGENKEILSATKVLTDTSPILQKLDPDGVDRIVTLPAPSSINPWFTIQNIGVLGSLLFQETDGINHEVGPGELIRLTTDGLDYSLEDIGFVESEHNRLSWFHYGGINNADNEFWTAMGQALDTLNTGTGQSNIYHVMTRPGTIQFLQYNWSATNGSVVTQKVWVNGAEVAVDYFRPPSPLSGSVRLRNPIPVLAGDRIAVRNGAPLGGVNPGAGTIALGILTRGGPIYCFAGDPPSTGTYFRALERADINLTGGFNNDREHIFFFDSSDIIMSWETQAGSGTTFQVHKNGALFDTVIPGSNAGFQVLTGTFLAGDRISVQWAAGGDPGDCTINFDAGGTPAECHYYGGAPNGGGVYFPTNHPIPVVFGATSPGADHMHTAHRSGRIVMTWRGGGAGVNGFQLMRIDSLGVVSLVETAGDLSQTDGRVLLTARAVSGNRYAVRTETNGAGDTIGMGIY